MKTKRVSKRKAQNLFHQKKPFLIGYKEYNGEGAFTQKARNAYPDHFDAGFNFCLNSKFTASQAMVMANGFSKRGYTDFSEGCAHYVLALICGANLGNGKIVIENPYNPDYVSIYEASNSQRTK